MEKFKINIPAEANELIYILQRNGHSAYVVGGCVRDSVLGRVPHDWDICTSATPDQMLEIFKGRRVIETGLQHGTITVMVKGEPYEITTYRIDGEYTDNRRPDSVSFTDNLLEDLKRRDFTINAMAYNDEEGLIDPFDGLIDIECHKIMCVGSAKERFEEDALRILRAIRFAAQLGFFVSENTKVQILEQKERLLNVSKERIHDELCKMIVCESFFEQLSMFQDVFATIIPEIKDTIYFNQRNPYHSFDVFMHTVNTLRFVDSQNLVVKLSLLFHDIGKPHCCQEGNDGYRHFKGHGKVSAEMTDKIMRDLKFCNDTREKVVQLVCYHDSTFELSRKCVKRWLNKIGEEQLRRLIFVRKADILGQGSYMRKERLEKIDNFEKIFNEVVNESPCFSMKDLAVNGKDLIDIGFKPGKELGSALNNLLQLVIDEELKNDKELLLEEAKKY